MKKRVPDPPYALHTKPGLTREEALQHALNYLEKALGNIALLPAPPMEHHLDMLNDALIELKVSKAMRPSRAPQKRSSR
ncbi:hypothetical protein [Pseudomonas putida]|uniref:hypothetical protein n=1 Tax=Pseudomonas putida TaxID=303 RepID=UPI00130E4808|nr:hypothetical protein [Pseudomonas putida]